MNLLSRKIDAKMGRVSDFPRPGVQFKDITPLFQEPELREEMLNAFVAFSTGKVDAVCGIESRGFLFGTLIAQRLNIPFVLIRKQGKLPPPVVSESYDLEYGNATIEAQPQYFKKGQRFLIHDDVLATGGTAAATAKLIKKCGSIPAQFSFIVDLIALKGKDPLLPYSTDIQCLISY